MLLLYSSRTNFIRSALTERPIQQVLDLPQVKRPIAWLREYDSVVPCAVVLCRHLVSNVPPVLTLSFLSFLICRRCSRIHQFILANNVQKLALHLNRCSARNSKLRSNKKLGVSIQPVSKAEGVDLDEVTHSLNVEHFGDGRWCFVESFCRVLPNNATPQRLVDLTNLQMLGQSCRSAAC